MQEKGGDRAIVPGSRLKGCVIAVLTTNQADGPSSFATQQVDTLRLNYDGIPADRHAGHLRNSGAREPWYKRGTEMRNERQLSLLSPDEMAEIAHRLGVPAVEAEWIGANVVVDGLARFSMLPPGTRLTFEHGAVVVIDGQNSPCRYAGGAIAANYPDRPDIELDFVKVAKRLRGLVGWVERPGMISAGDEVTARIREQWIY